MNRNYKHRESVFLLSLLAVLLAFGSDSLGTRCVYAQDSTSTAKKVVVAVSNSNSTGTTRYRLVKLSGAPSKAVIVGTSDTDGAIGIVIGGAGTSGIATIQTSGETMSETTIKYINLNNRADAQAVSELVREEIKDATGGDLLPIQPFNPETDDVAAKLNELIEAANVTRHGS